MALKCWIILTISVSTATTLTAHLKGVDCPVSNHHLDYVLKAVNEATFYVRRTGDLSKLSLRVYDFDGYWDVHLQPHVIDFQPNSWQMFRVTKQGDVLRVYMGVKVIHSSAVYGYSSINHLTVTLQGSGELALCIPPPNETSKVAPIVIPVLVVVVAAVVCLACWWSRRRPQRRSNIHAHEDTTVDTIELE